MVSPESCGSTDKHRCPQLTPAGVGLAGDLPDVVLVGLSRKNRFATTF